MTVSASVEVKNKLGIHARPAMMLFELVQGFDAHVLLRNEDGIEADAEIGRASCRERVSSPV